MIHSRKKHLQNSVHDLLANHDDSQLNAQLHETTSRATLQHKYISYTTGCLGSPVTQIQADWKVTQPILKYLLMVVIQYNLIGLINTLNCCDCEKAHAGHVML
jgi:hypothetical protein